VDRIATCFRSKRSAVGRFDAPFPHLLNSGIQATYPPKEGFTCKVTPAVN
jgi:hypothetical protein